MTSASDTPAFSNTDRLGVSLFGAALFHMALILGVTFTIPKPPASTQGNLEITLVQTRSDRAPLDPQFLAQANQDGGGDSDNPDIARSPLPVQEMSDENTSLPFARRAPQKSVASNAEIHSLMTQKDAEKKLRTLAATPEKRDERLQPANPGLIEQDQQERARLSAEIDRSWQEYQKRPREKFLTARTQEYKYAVYMDTLFALVERVGNLKPEQAKRQHLSGSVMLDVAINSDGTVKAISMLRSSGHKILDDAAIRSVELAAPFEPFPPEIRADFDVLHVTRTWKYTYDSLKTESN